jgi:hypothetical protein
MPLIIVKNTVDTQAHHFIVMTRFTFATTIPARNEMVPIKCVAAL